MARYLLSLIFALITAIWLPETGQSSGMERNEIRRDSGQNENRVEENEIRVERNKTGLDRNEIRLDSEQSDLFRSWFLRIVAEELRRGPSPRWVNRDCAGLIRFAVNETLRIHDGNWRKASGMGRRPLPPEIILSSGQTQLRNRWMTHEGDYQAYVSAIGLVQGNTVFVSRSVLEARPGDLLFFDQGDDQHLMIWTGDGVAYHRGKSTIDDNGLRAVSLQQLMNWKDTRWQPNIENSNFIGVYRFSFLSR